MVSLIIDFFAQESAGGNILGFFWVFYNQFFAHVSAGSIFRVLLEHFVSEVVRN